MAPTCVQRHRLGRIKTSLGPDLTRHALEYMAGGSRGNHRERLLARGFPVVKERRARTMTIDEWYDMSIRRTA